MDLITYALSKNYTDKKVSKLSAENVTAALGYTPADKETVESLSEEISELDAIINGVESSGGDEPSGGEAQRIAFEFGGMDTSGNLVTNQVRIRSELFAVSEGVNNYQLFVGGDNYYFYGCTGFLNGAYARKVNYNEYATDITNGTFSVTSDGTFDAVRIVFKKTDDSTFSQTEVDGTYLLGENESTSGGTSPIFVGGLKSDVYRWQGKKLAAIGDSITYGYIPRNAPGYPGKLNSYAILAAERLKMTVVNKGITGSTVSNQEDKNPMCNRYDELPDDADIVTVMGGTNDVRVGVSLGTMDDRTTDTYYGALHTLLGGLYKKYYIDQQRNTKIIVMTPIKLLQSSASEIGGTGTLRSWDDWIEAVKKVAAYYSLPVLDMYNLSRINPHLNQTVQGTVEGYTGVYNPYITDGTHPTQEGHELMADALVGFIRGLD